MINHGTPLRHTPTHKRVHDHISSSPLLQVHVKLNAVGHQRYWEIQDRIKAGIHGYQRTVTHSVYPAVRRITLATHKAHTLHHVDAMYAVKIAAEATICQSPFFFFVGLRFRIYQGGRLGPLTCFQVPDNRATPQCSAAACISTIRAHQSHTH